LRKIGGISYAERVRIKRGGGKNESDLGKVKTSKKARKARGKKGERPKKQ